MNHVNSLAQKLAVTVACFYFDPKLEQEGTDNFQ
jgi:hypothetical protein